MVSFSTKVQGTVMKATAPQPILLKDYKVPTHLIPTVELEFDLHETATVVRSRLAVQRNPASKEKHANLVLNGENLVLQSVSMNGVALTEEIDYTVTETTLTINAPKEHFTLEICNTINPKENTALDGLYVSGNILCTQCEPEGFRKITYFLDRSDVMAVYTVKMMADHRIYPLLLSNGNKVEEGALEDGRHFVVWNDPFPKPSYLFALVAGALGVMKDTFMTQSGKTVALRIYSDFGKETRCLHALESLKKAMRWDEERFGLEYDLDRFMIVAVDSFNFGAMENKALNIFNSNCALADPETATDDNFLRVEGVIAHEYFHNWTGNRVTCRDWFQLTLKEGLTVYRDQEFTSDMNSRPVKRIEDVVHLRKTQFTEDAGPTAHPIKPDSYIQINNFYTTTIYQKGSEVIRMIETLIGREAFRKGIETYFALYDGQAVRTEDFVHAMSQASGRDFTQFMRWYHQAGTPHVKACWDYDSKKQTLALYIEQQTPKTADGSPKEPFDFPLAVGLLGEGGKALTASLADPKQLARKEGSSFILEVTKPKETFVFEGVKEKPVLSLNRNFSAPIKLQMAHTEQDKLFLMAYDSDAFNRWDAGQELALQALLKDIERFKQSGKLEAVSAEYLKAFKEVLLDKNLDLALKALALSLPSETSIGQEMEIIDFDSIHAVREHWLSSIAHTFEKELRELYHSLMSDKPYIFDAKAVGRRSLKNLALSYLTYINKREYLDLCSGQYQWANNMTDRLAALSLLCQVNCKEQTDALHAFADEWAEDSLVLCKWFAVQAASKLPGTVERVRQLKASPLFDIGVPNIIRALFTTFSQNLHKFHQKDGKGYTLLADMIIELDPKNPQIAARLSEGFRQYGRLDQGRRQAMGRELQRILATPNLSRNTYEMVSRTYGQ